jgi:hypothetical protein
MAAAAGADFGPPVTPIRLGETLLQALRATAVNYQGDAR